MLIGTLLYLILGWSSFPDQIPAHYNAAGEIDRYGGKGEIFFIEVVMWLMYLGIGLLEKYPESWNTGVKVTPANREKVYCTVRYFIKTLKLSTTLIFAFLVITSLQCSPLPGWFTTRVADPGLRRNGVLADPSLSDKKGLSVRRYGIRRYLIRWFPIIWYPSDSIR